MTTVIKRSLCGLDGGRVRVLVLACGRIVMVDVLLHPYVFRILIALAYSSLGPEQDVKTEASSTVIPEASPRNRTSTPLRRRRSRLSQNPSDEDS
jgi:hypothetical protein